MDTGRAQGVPGPVALYGSATMTASFAAKALAHVARATWCHV